MALRLEQALPMVLESVRAVSARRMDLAQCWRRVLAEEIVASTDFPPFDRTPLDGYALWAEEVEAATPERPVWLRQIDSIAAGQEADCSLSGGTACRIMTGAPLPRGATGIVRYEDTELCGDVVKINHGKGAGLNICRQGEEIRKGQKVFAKGTVINSGVMGMLAVLGIACPLVFEKPKVGLLATGSEIVGVDSELSPGKIRDSNSYMLAAQVREAGGEPVFLAKAADDVGQIISSLANAGELDIIVTTGGASGGDYDFIGEAFAAFGVRLLFDRLSMKPGMPTLAGLYGNTLFFGLSGNPAAAGIAFEQLVRPALLKMGGFANFARAKLTARLTADIVKGGGPVRFVWAQYWQAGAELVVKPLALQGNGMLKSSADANALIVVPENSGPVKAGTVVEITTFCTV